MKCIRCRLEIPESAKFCPSCGKKQPNQNTDPDAPLVWDGERTTCPRCRRETPADTDSVFCAWCRMRLPVKQAPAVPIPVKLSGRIKACIRPCCSKAIPEEALFCPWCGKQQQSRPKPPDRDSSRLRACFCFVRPERQKCPCKRILLYSILLPFELLEALCTVSAGLPALSGPAL